MLPRFREKIIEHIKIKFGMDAEICTTDTHSINSISSSASSSLGRYTDANDVIKIIDTMVKKALADTEPVSYAYKKTKVADFPVWGEKADMLIERTSQEVQRMIKYVAPLLLMLAFIVAAWVIYVV